LSYDSLAREGRGGQAGNLEPQRRGRTPPGKKLGCSSAAADVSDLNSVTGAVQKTLGIVPTINIFINDAGISGPNPKLWEYPADDWKRIFAVNVEGTFYCCRVVAPLMHERNYSRIVTLLLLRGRMAIQIHPPIAPAKPP